MSRHCPKIFLIHTFFPGKLKKCLRTQLSEWMMRLRDTWERSRNDLKPGSSYSAWICVLTQMNSWTVTTDLSVSRAALFHYRFFCPGIIILTFFLYNKFTLLFTLLSCRVPAFNQVGLIYMLNASPTAFDNDVYQPRNPKASAYYRCVEDHFEQLETVWLPARRTYSSERMNVIRDTLAFGDLMWPMSSGAIWPPARRA